MMVSIHQGAESVINLYEDRLRQIESANRLSAISHDEVEAE